MQSKMCIRDSLQEHAAQDIFGIIGNAKCSGEGLFAENNGVDLNESQIRELMNDWLNDIGGVCAVCCNNIGDRHWIFGMSEN